MDKSLIKFKYEVKIGNDSGFIAATKNEKQFDGIEEMVVYSKQFTSYAECRDGLTNVLIHLIKCESANKTNQVIVSQPHPNLENPEKISRAPVEGWDNYTLLRQYIADPEKLKSAVLSYQIMGQISADHEIHLSSQLTG